MGETQSRVPTRRDFAQTRERLGAWFAARMADMDAVTVTGLRQAASGGSNETLIAELLAVRGGRASVVEFVIRVQPTFFQLFLRVDLGRQYRLLEHLHAAGEVPVPAMLFLESDPSIMGAPFWVMEKVEGDVPSDLPSYNESGFLYDASPRERRKLWASGIAAMAAVHRTDVAKLPALVEQRPGESGLDENLRHWHESMLWAAGGQPLPLLEQGHAWLDENRPGDAPAGLSWGDARVGNMIFRNFACVAALDWEQVSLGGPVLDLAHWICVDDALTEGSGHKRLEGIGVRAETIAAWRDMTGLSADALEWFDVMAAFRLVIIRTRHARLVSRGVTQNSIPHVDDFFSRRLARLLRLSAPRRTPLAKQAAAPSN